eukprot:m51a1_g964 hypothetical protein (690) ;mRNA; r:358250-360630
MSELSTPISIKNAKGPKWRSIYPHDKHVLVPGATYVHSPPVVAPQAILNPGVASFFEKPNQCVVEPQSSPSGSQVSALDVFSITSNFLLAPQGTGDCGDSSDLKAALAAVYGDRILVSAGREAFIDWFCDTVSRLDRGMLEGVGHCTAVLGARGVGKTYLLRALCYALSRRVRDTYFCCVDLKSVTLAGGTPAEEALRMLGQPCPEGLQPTVYLDLLIHHLSATRKCAVLVADEFDCVFQQQAGPADAIVSQLIAMSKTQGERRISAVVSGSSPYMRRLMFGHLSDSLKLQFPGYAGKHFNDRKFSAYNLPLIPWIDGVNAALKAIGAGGTLDPLALLLNSRGNVQIIADEANGQQRELDESARWNTKRSRDEFAMRVWQALICSLDARMVDLAFEHLTSPRPEARPVLPDVSLRDLVAKFAELNAGEELTLDRLWDPSDQQYIELTPRNRTYYVRFSHIADMRLAYDENVLLEETLFGRPLKRLMSTFEKSALLNPKGMTSHQKLIAESLAHSFVGDAAGSAVHLAYRGRVVKTALQGLNCGRDGQRSVDIACRKQWDGELFQLSNGVFETDLVAIFAGVGFTSVGVWLFQLKVAEKESSLLPLDDVRTISKRFDDGSAQLIAALGADAGAAVSQHRFIVTTRRVDSQTLATAEELGLSIIGREKMATLWSPRNREFIESEPRLKYLL